MWRAGVPRVRRSPASFSLAAASTWPCCRTPPWISQRCLESQSLRDRTGGGGRSGGGEGQDSGATQRCEPSTLLQSAHCLSVTTTGGAGYPGPLQCRVRSQASAENSVWYPPPCGQGPLPVAGPPRPGASAFPGAGSHWLLSCCSGC